MDEYQLIISFINGDEKGFKMIFESYHRQLIYLAQGIIPYSTEIEDIVQEAFLKLWDRRENFAHLDAIKSFLYICVKNTCLNHLKHDKVSDKYRSRLDKFSDEQNVMLKMIEAEVLQDIHMAIKKLPLGCQKVVYYGYFKEMTNNEVANKLNVSVNTVKTQKMRALKGLKLILKDLPLGFVLFFIVDSI